jgi:hypothetical protein
MAGQNWDSLYISPLGSIHVGWQIVQQFSSRGPPPTLAGKGVKDMQADAQDLYPPPPIPGKMKACLITRYWQPAFKDTSPGGSRGFNSWSREHQISMENYVQSSRIQGRKSHQSGISMQGRTDSKVVPPQYRSQVLDLEARKDRKYIQSIAEQNRRIAGGLQTLRGIR